MSFCVSFQLTAQIGNPNYFPPSNYGGKQQIHKLIDHETDYTHLPPRGTVYVMVIIDKAGKLTGKRIFKTSDNQFNKQTLELIDKLCWHPATSYGEKVTSELLVKLVFNKKRQNKMLANSLFELTTPKSLENDSIFPISRVNQLPEPIYPKKNYTSIQHYVLDNFIYPTAAVKYTIEGKVKVEYVVEPSGYASNLRIVNQLGGGCDVEVIRLINLLYFQPAFKDERPVRVRVVTEIFLTVPDVLLQTH